MNLDEHLLILLIEECAEIQQAATKILRFGKYASNPKIPLGIHNLEHLKNELHDLRVVLELCSESKDLDVHYCSKRLDKTRTKKRHYIQVSRDMRRIMD